jgi:argininosuccinate lyase
MPFREAYVQVGKMIEAGEFNGSSREINHTHLGSIGNLGLTEIQAQKDSVWNRFGFEKVEDAIGDLLS